MRDIGQERFISQMEKAVDMAEIKYPKSSGWRHVWVFDRSSWHTAMANESFKTSII